MRLLYPPGPRRVLGCIVLTLMLALSPWFAGGPVQADQSDISIQPDSIALLRFLFLDELRLPRKADRIELQKDALAVLLGYEGFITRVEASDKGEIFFVMKSGARILYDDGRPKTFEQRLNQPDVQDMMHLPYQPGPVTKPVPENYDPGRFRVERFLRSVYGDTERRIRENLVPVDFCGTRVKFNVQNGAASALKLVNADLSSLLRKNPNIEPFVTPLGGTYNNRVIEGTDRMSPHSFGIAIDLNPKRGAYWRWAGKKLDPFALRRGYPTEIISVFEKHGFIWGGKWAHYDLMHFEYRPELLIKWQLQQHGRAHANQPKGLPAQ